MEIIKKFHIGLSLTPILLFSLGYITHLSVSPDRAQNHLIFFLIGLILYIAFSLIDYHFLHVVYKPFYFVVLGLLLFLLILGDVILGSARWIDLGVFTIQPSEMAKLSLVMYLAFYLFERENEKDVDKILLNIMYFFIPMFLLVLIQPDLGTSIILLACLMGVLFLNGFNIRYFMLAFALFGILSAPLWSLLKDYQKYRILVFLNPSLDTLGRGYNVIQSLIAIGSGGILGKGFGRGTQNHLNFLPIYWTDFVAASFAEEWGFIGISILIIIFAYLFFVMLSIAHNTEDSVGKYLVTGVFMIFFSQVIINLGMNIGLLPVTGITLPFISYGGSSMLISMSLLGILHSVWINGKRL